MEDKLQTLGKIYGDYICFDSSETTVTNYTKLAEEYEKDFVGLGYDTPHVLARWLPLIEISLVVNNFIYYE